MGPKRINNLVETNCDLFQLFVRNKYLVRHVRNDHSSLLPKSSTGDKLMQTKLELHKAKIAPRYSDEGLKVYIVKYIVCEDISFKSVESLEFRELLHFIRPESVIPKKEKRYQNFREEANSNAGSLG
jgi:hypothetical protein